MQLPDLLHYRIHDPSTILGAIFYGVVFLAAAWLCSFLLRRTIKHAIHYDRKGLIDRTAAPFLLALIRVSTYVIFFVIYAHWIPALREVGHAMLTGASVVSVVLGLAAQNTLGNLIAGVSILMYRPFAAGDRLQVETPEGPQVGVVENVTLGHTVLVTWENKRIVIPNSQIANQTTINMSSQDPATVVNVPITIAHSSDVDRARQILTELAEQHDNVNAFVDVPITDLDERGVTISLRARCPDQSLTYAVKHDLYQQAKQRFDGEGIEIPYRYTNVILQDNRRVSAAL